MATHVRVRKFDPETIKNHRIMLLVGRRGSGKSTLLADLLYRLRDRFDFCLAMCPTMESANMLRGCMPASCVYDRFSAAKLELLISTARELAAQGKEKNFLIVLDDCLFERGITRSTAFRFLFLNGRHIRVSCICLLQYCVDLPPDLRANVDYVFSMREPMLTNRIKLWKNFFGCFSSAEDFSSCLERCTQNYECMLMDATSNGSGVADCIFWYKASKDLPPFQLGLRLYYTLTERYRRVEGSTPSAEEQESGPSKKKPTFVVHKEDGSDEDR